MKKILLILSLAAMGLVSCEMDHYRSDTMTSTQLKDDPGAAVYTTDGNYSLFKDVLEYKGSTDSGNSYVRHFFQMAEFRGDNACLSGRTSDPFYEAFNYTDNGGLKNNKYFWWIAYKIIYGANSNIEAIDENSSNEASHMKGENYFMRAICHFHLVNLYAKPYSCGRENMGVVLRNSTDCSVTERATVGQVYDQIVSDLQEAARLMEKGSRRGDAGYISREAALALLTRVHLYMGNNDEVINIANELLGGDPSSKLDPDLANIFVNARSSKETLWCVAHVATETAARSSIGSMYYSPNGTGGTGWGEIYWSDPMLELMERYPEDKRLAAYYELYDQQADGKAMVHWPMFQGDDTNWYTNNIVTDVEKNADGKWAFSYSGKNYVVEEKVVNGYKEYYVEGYEAGKQTKVYVRPNTTKINGIRQNFPMYQMKKFSGQDGDSNLSSPIMIRWAEVILNRAEALAKTGADGSAIADVNVIRTRAGIPAWGADHAWADHGYADVLSVVLDERRRELCFEGHRAFDVWRNQMSMDRRFAGAHPWEVVDYTDDRIPYKIPQDEIDVSGIPQN